MCLSISFCTKSERQSDWAAGEVIDIHKLPGLLTKGNQKAKCRIKPKWKAESKSHILNMNTGGNVPDSSLR